MSAWIIGRKGKIQRREQNYFKGKGALSVRAKEITELMKQRASYAIASMIPDEELTPENIIASPLNKGVADVVAKAVADTAIEEGIARI